MNQQQVDFPDAMSLSPSVTSAQLIVKRMGVRRSRQRGVVLTEHGWKKLLETKVLQNQYGEWHTYGLLGDRALLSPRTVSKIVGCEMGVDRRTLKQFFHAFSLPLESGDYCMAKAMQSRSQILATEL
ncbi:MAG: hypothetical protein KME45_26030 [Stenomitos rutilans HA7619-LM2]|nr:hypothetical protein [Stenomitos rutilans HA7619-LM2]